MFVGLVQLYSAVTGELLAIMPDGLIQQTRVGVTSALGMKVMARKNRRPWASSAPAVRLKRITAT